MATINLTVAARNTLLDRLALLLDPTVGGGKGTINIYSGTKPANADAAVTGTLLGTLTFADPVAPSSSGGVLTMSAITQDVSADATATASWARVFDASGATVFDGTVTATGGGGFIELNTVAIVAGGPIQITGMQLSIPA
ncbi:hypothetical protein [Sandarakinorhabdus sp. DWP1-3-1]|uniref:hypothetical protein n=1 Tax=Sandarakinorhabdus sp. DWP1-3-1 TaxID=2804627 RepID=UPI003CEBD765